MLDSYILAHFVRQLLSVCSLLLVCMHAAALALSFCCFTTWYASSLTQYALLRVSASFMCSGHDSQMQDLAFTYGRCIGLAFQVCCHTVDASCMLPGVNLLRQFQLVVYMQIGRGSWWCIRELVSRDRVSSPLCVPCVESTVPLSSGFPQQNTLSHSGPLRIPPPMRFLLLLTLFLSLLMMC